MSTFVHLGRAGLLESTQTPLLPTSYLAHCTNDDCKSFKGDSGNVWVKIEQLAYNPLAPGEYLLRHEILGLHVAGTVMGAQFYPSCTQIRVTEGGSTQLPSGIALPGAYDPYAWTEGGSEASSEWLHKLVDPANNTAIDIHEYPDEDFSTTWPPRTVDRLDGRGGRAVLGHRQPVLHRPEPVRESRAGGGGGQSGRRLAEPVRYDTVWVPVLQKNVPTKLQWGGPAIVNGGVIVSG
ncbi:glycosyl hydrolase family 61-domain-containing protein [Thermothelomyces heterothallicus CBS 202.75]|uniref:glycosyl hydrolase family 61-domain-containing protein n=1 Tax=Thermothelomyces heterothallicus CBS 202.75 TaxID=1149848 RepID=UPI0037433676